MQATGKNRLFTLLIALLAVCLLLAPACTKERDDDLPYAPPPAGDDDEDQDTPGGPVWDHYIKLDVDLWDEAGLYFNENEDGTLYGFIAFAGGNDILMGGGVPMECRGEILEFPETTTKLYSMTFTSPYVETGPCKTRRISVALTLASRDDNGYLVGSMAARCDRNNFNGRVLRVIKVSGLMEDVAPE